jgi:hypothetical protein
MVSLSKAPYSILWKKSSMSILPSDELSKLLLMSFNTECSYGILDFFLKLIAKGVFSFLETLD